MRNVHDYIDVVDLDASLPPPSSKPSPIISGVHQIVRLRQILQQWRRRAAANLDRTFHAMSPRSKKLQMRGSASSSISSRLSSASSSPPAAGVEQAMELPPEGYLAVYVGRERRRFMIRTEHINHPLFRALLDRTEEEFGLINRQGGLTLPACEVVFFEHMLWMVESHYLDHLHDVNDPTELRELLDFYHVGLWSPARNVSCLQEASHEDISSGHGGKSCERSASAITSGRLC